MNAYMCMHWEPSWKVLSNFCSCWYQCLWFQSQPLRIGGIASSPCWTTKIGYRSGMEHWSQKKWLSSVCQFFMEAFAGPTCTLSYCRGMGTAWSGYHRDGVVFHLSNVTDSVKDILWDVRSAWREAEFHGIIEDLETFISLETVMIAEILLIYSQ